MQWRWVTSAISMKPSGILAGWSLGALVSRFQRVRTTIRMMNVIRLVSPDRPRAVAKPMLDTRFERDDYSLIAGIRRGDPTAATALFEQYHALVERTLVRVLGFDSELADAVQETFIRALGSTRLLRDPQALPSWLIRISVCTASDLIRKRKRRWWLQLFSGTQDPVDAADEWVADAESDLEARQALQAAQAILNTLPVQEKVAFSLRRFEGMELKDVAQACGCSLATIKRRLVRAETRFLAQVHKYPVLEKWLAENGGEES
jgi:RNA polymerase sigma-70 factor, ECF subfamily